MKDKSIHLGIHKSVIFDVHNDKYTFVSNLLGYIKLDLQ